ncbi:PREDICTED: intraflagellar transport protein 43 homolog [Rhagoletis zephyria]|uniref:intraflagellar transport protein 43 homolog n=1 Tax=Rhagoletis zephyria TaxID=28612 RepID=UPI000811A282|nr:PREDICTED: intraflagellar transport protein 43 homolog [Rhagoletis zephyria]XP_036328961.1 intraflagellar transport protein 43 homolog [Rhagoletis pomonella]
MMDWAEELKLSIRKKTARKGRRSKSRDPIGGASTSINVTNPNEKEIAIDITLGMHKDTSTAASEEADTSKRPPVRRISGGWADVGILKSTKSKKGASFDDERFQSVSLAKSPIGSPPRDDIPTIPDMDDLKDEILLNEIVEPPAASNLRPNTLSELNLDLLNQNAFASLENINLSILTRCLKLPETLDEPDEVWEWDKLFTDVIAEIHSEQQSFAGSQKKEIGPDEIPPPMYA